MVSDGIEEIKIMFDSERLRKLLELTKTEDSEGRFRVTIEFDDYQDFGCVRDGDGNILAEASTPLEHGEEDEEIQEACNDAIRSAIDKI